MRNSEYVKLSVGHADAAEHQTVALQRLNRVDAHAAHHLFDFMLPCSHQIDESLTSRIDIEPFDQLCVLGGDTPVAFPGLAGSAQVASQSKQSGCPDIAGIRAQRNGLDRICGGANAAADDQRNMISDSFVTQTLIHSSQRKFYGDSHIVTNTGGGGSGAAAEAVNGNDVCSAAGDPAGDGSDVVDSGYLDDDGFLVICRFFQGIDELPQIFNIFMGQMSIIGPRPALWNQDDLYAEREKYGANDVMPGLTGWAQINGRDELPIDVKAKLDGEYVEKLSFGFDVKCFFGTITSVLKRDGVVEGGTGAMEKEKEENNK